MNNILKLDYKTFKPSIKINCVINRDGPAPPHPKVPRDVIILYIYIYSFT